MTRRQPKVLETDYHRNGIGGEGFRVSIVQDPEHGRMLVIDFSYSWEYVKPEDRDEDYVDNYGYTAVLNLDQAAEGNIYMFGHGAHAGGNAWRGDSTGRHLPSADRSRGRGPVREVPRGDRRAAQGTKRMSKTTIRDYGRALATRGERMSTQEDREWDAHLDRIAEDQEAREAAEGEDWRESALTVWERNR